MKASEWIKDALQELGVSAAETPVTPDQFQTGVRYANRLMGQYENLGLGYTVIANAGDEVTIPTYAEQWAVTALAVRLSPQFGPNESLLELKEAERVAYRQMLQHIDMDIAMDYPSILPVGSGNECYRNDIRFYPGPEDNLLTEQGDYLIAED